MTNIILLSLTLVTNQQQAIVGQSSGKAHLATQAIVSQRAELGYVSGGKTIPLGALLSVVGTSISTNLIPIAMAAPIPSPAIPLQITQTNAAAKAGINTNSPAYKRRLEREARMRGTNAPVK